MKPSPIVAVIFAELQEDAERAPRWFGPAMAVLLVWAAGGIYLTSRRHAAMKAAAVLMASQEPHGK